MEKSLQDNEYVLNKGIIRASVEESGDLILYNCIFNNEKKKDFVYPYYSFYDFDQDGVKELIKCGEESFHRKSIWSLENNEFVERATMTVIYGYYPESGILVSGNPALNGDRYYDYLKNGKYKRLVMEYYRGSEREIILSYDSFSESFNTVLSEEERDKLLQSFFTDEEWKIFLSDMDSIIPTDYTGGGNSEKYLGNMHEWNEGELRRALLSEDALSWIQQSKEVGALDLTGVSIGDTALFGSWEQDGDTLGGIEPIE